MKVDKVDISKTLMACGLQLNLHDFENDFGTPYVGINDIFGIHHVHDWYFGYENESGYSGTRRQFYADMGEMISFFNQYIAERSIKEFIVAPFHKVRQFEFIDEDCDIYQEIKLFLMSHNVRSNSHAGIKLSIEETNLFEMLFEGAFRGVSLLSLFFPETGTLISPSHHFGVPFFTARPCVEKKAIKLLLNSYPNLKFYEKDLFE